MLSTRRPLWTSLSLITLAALCYRTSLLQAQEKPKQVIWTHAFDLASRKFGENEFSKNTRKYGVESFKDQNNNLGLFISESGSLGITSDGFQPIKERIASSKGPAWLTGLDLPVRKVGENEFTKQTKVHSLEVFRDPNTENWLLITETGRLATIPARTKGKKDIAPKWLHSIDLSVRKGGAKDWKEALKYGIEVYRDGNSDNLIYACESGSIAVAPETSPVMGKGKAPAWLHGLDLACRKHNEPSFTKETRKYGVEVFHDVTTGNLIFICETGTIAVAPAPKDVKAPTGNVKQPRWTHGINLKCRVYGETDFSDKTQVFGGEVFHDENVNVTIYINEAGSIAACATPKMMP